MLKFTMTKEKIFHNDNKILVVWLLLWSTLHLVLCISMILLKEHFCWCKSKLSKEVSCLNLLWVQVPDLWFFFLPYIFLLQNRHAKYVHKALYKRVTNLLQKTLLETSNNICYEILIYLPNLIRSTTLQSTPSLFPPLVLNDCRD